MTANLSSSNNNTVESSTTEMIHRKPPTKTSEHRRITKPIMEKKRRARINNSLNELKVLILDALNKDPSRHSKLEKADILEMTVRHLQKLQRQQVAATIVNDPGTLNKYRAGFSECTAEVGRYMGQVENGFDQTVRQRILSHLNHCLNSLNQMAANVQFGTPVQKPAFPGMIPPPNNPLHVNVFAGRDINNNNHRTVIDETLNIKNSTITTPPSSASSTSSHFAFNLNLTSPTTINTKNQPISLSTAHHQDIYSFGKNISPGSSSSSSAGLSSPGSTMSFGDSSMMSPLGLDLAVDLATKKNQSLPNVDDENVWRPW